MSVVKSMRRHRHDWTFDRFAGTGDLYCAAFNWVPPCQAELTFQDVLDLFALLYRRSDAIEDTLVRKGYQYV